MRVLTWFLVVKLSVHRVFLMEYDQRSDRNAFEWRLEGQTIPIPPWSCRCCGVALIDLVCAFPMNEYRQLWHSASYSYSKHILNSIAQIFSFFGILSNVCTNWSSSNKEIKMRLKRRGRGSRLFRFLINRSVGTGFLLQGTDCYNWSETNSLVFQSVDWLKRSNFVVFSPGVPAVWNEPLASVCVGYRTCFRQFCETTEVLAYVNEPTPVSN